MSTATPTRTARIPRDMEQAARDAHPDELAGEPVAVLLRAGLAALAGATLDDAIRQAHESRQPFGRKPAAKPGAKPADQT